jgi:hypothetical protein
MTIWYLWAIKDDPTTNEYLAHVIGEQYPDSACRDKLCSDGVRRNLYRCPPGAYAKVQSAIAGVSVYNLKLEVFRETAGGEIAQYNLWKHSVRKRARSTRLMGGVHRAS